MPKYKQLFHEAQDLIAELHQEIKKLKLELSGGSCDYCIHNDCLECVEE